MSFTFLNLPGVQVATVDGGLAAVNTPTTQAILVFGTSAIGPANSPFQVVSLAQAAKTFGLNGTLIRGMSESATYSDNVSLFRAGASQGTVLVGQTGSTVLGPVNIVLSATRLGGVAHYVLSATVDASVVQGSTVQIDGCLTESFDGLFTVLSISTTTFTNDTINIEQLNLPDVATEPENVINVNRDDFSITTGVTLTITGGVATLDWTAATPNNYPSAIDNGDQIVLAGLNGAAAAYDGTYKISSHVGTTQLLFGSGLTNHSAITLTTGTLQADTLSLSTPPQTGFLITLGQVDATANIRYKIFYNGAGILSLWLDNNLVFSNDPAGPVNTGDSSVSGSSVGGSQVNDGTNIDALANALTIAAAVSSMVVVYVAPVDGIGLTNRDLYVAQQNAMNLVAGFPTDIAVVPGALANVPNVAFYVSTNPATAVNNPATNPQALDWLWTGLDVNNNPIYQYASEAFFRTSDNRQVSSAVLQGQSAPTVAIVKTFSSATDRLTKGVGSSNLQPNGFHEINFAYQLARFCAAQSEAPQADNGGCLGFIGTQGPASLSDFSLPAVKAWIGSLPQLDPISGHATVSGTGLLGIPFLVGASASTLNTLCADQGNGFRIPGLFSTDSGEYDGGAEIDANGFKVDIGAYLSVQGDYALQSNGFGTYVGNIAGVVAGLTSSLDQKRAVTNKQVAGVSQLYRASLQQLDDLTFADINVLRFKGTGQLPVALHDKTSATAASDYTLALRQRIKFLIIQVLLRQAQNFIGNGTNDGLSLTALKTALDTDSLNLQKRGYISSYNFTITSTKAQQKVGQASIQISFVPANELVQLNATVGINLAA